MATIFGTNMLDHRKSAEKPKLLYHIEDGSYVSSSRSQNQNDLQVNGIHYCTKQTKVGVDAWWQVRLEPEISRVMR